MMFSFHQRRRKPQADSRFEFVRLEPRKLLSANLGNENSVCFVDDVELYPPKQDTDLGDKNDGGDGTAFKLPPTVVGDYVDDFTSPNAPANWQYFWNESGDFGDSNSYSALTWESWRYYPVDQPFPYLGPANGHPGFDDSVTPNVEWFAVAAYTVTEDGEYSIGDSTITREGEFGDGIEVAVHVNDGPVTDLLQLEPTATGSFDFDLGTLSAGDTIYVGVGPDGPNSGVSAGNDGYSWDFSIFLDVSSPETVTVDLDTQRYVGDVSTLDRSKFFNFHSSGGGNDAQIQEFMDTYGVGTGRQFWGALPYAKNQTGAVGSYPDVTPSTDETVRPADRIIQTGHPRDALRWDTDLQAAAEWVTTYYTTIVDSVPEFYEPINEPFVHAGDSEFSDAPSTDAMRLKMAQLYAALGEAIQNTPALANMNVVGYSSAWPSLELWDFGHWDSRMKMFMDVAGEFMDAFSTHLYDGVNVTGQNNRRSGSNSEAILDLIETYSYTKWGLVKPHAITEFGGIESGYGDTYTDIRSAQSIRSINHIMFNLLERENDLMINIPFISDKATWFIDPANGCEAYGATLWRLDNPDLSDCSGDFVYTWRVNFFELWQDVQGERASIQTSDPDIQAQVFVDGNTAYVAVNNLADGTETINLEFASGLTGLQNVEIREMEIPIDAALNPTYTETTQSTAPDSVTLDSGGSAVLVYNFDSPIDFSSTVRSSKYYTSNHLQPINANETLSFTFNDVQVSTEGEASIRMSIGRTHDRSKAPEVTFNGTTIDVPGDWAGYDQANRDDFFGMIEIPVPMSLLAESNTVEVTFPDSGGRVASMILNVEAVDIVPELSDVMVNLGDSGRSDVNQLTLNFAGLVDFGPDAFSVVQRSDQSGATGTAVNTSFTSQTVDGNTLVSITFDSLTRNSVGSLIDGNYELTVNAASVTSLTGNQMETDFVFGDTEDEAFFAFFGDDNGNRNVNIFDLLPFRQTYLASVGDAEFNPAMDYDANGTVNVIDLLRFRQRYNDALAFV